MDLSERRKRKAQHPEKKGERTLSPLEPEENDYQMIGSEMLLNH